MSNLNDQTDSSDSPDDLLYQLALIMENTAADKVNIEEDREQDEHLPQKLSQLSSGCRNDEKQPLEENLTTNTNKRSSTIMSTSCCSSTISKKIKLSVPNEIEEVKEQIPTYLSIDHPAFQQLIQSILSTTANSFYTKDIQEVALLLRQITILDLQKLLWNEYLRSGTGKLEQNRSSSSNHLSLCIWPMEMKSTMIKKEEDIKNKKMTELNLSKINDDTCLQYVYQTLYQLVDRQMEYQKELDKKKEELKYFFTSDKEDVLIEFLEEKELGCIRIEYESKMAIVKYDYQDQLLVYEYKRLKPNQYQLQLFEHLTKIKQDKEKSYYEVAMLKQRLLQNFLPEPLHSLQLPLPSSTSASINTISDPTSRHNLLEQYTKIIKQTKSEMMTLYITIAEVKMRECQFQFDHDILQMRPNQRLTTIDRCLSELMIAIVERRFKNIDERLKYLYNLKLRFLNQKKA